MNEERYYQTGLNKSQVKERISKGQINDLEEPKTKSIKEIIETNTFTFFNIINVVLGALVILSGIMSKDLFYSLKNCLFVGVAFINTFIAITQEILAKRSIDKLNVLASTKITAIRDGVEIKIPKEQIVLDDVCVYNAGAQVVTDSIILKGNVEVNESFITGESKNIYKKEGEEILSGSFVVSGKCYVKVLKVGKENYISKITCEAKYLKNINSVIYNSFDSLVKILSICLVPVGLLFFFEQLSLTNFDIPSSIMSTVSAVIGMIPEGLVLLTSSAMAISVIRLRKQNILVQELYATENLARVDVICLDKTGTLTEGKMNLAKIIPKNSYKLEDIKLILGNYINALDDTSETFNAICESIKKQNNYNFVDKKEFSSERKYSAVSFKEGNFYLGSPENLLKDVNDKEIEKYQENSRVLVFVKGKGNLLDINDLEILAYLIIDDKIKKNAKDTINFFEKNKLQVKIISGDNENTIKNIALKAEINSPNSISMDKVEDIDIPSIVEKYNIFARVKPHQKKLIINALQKNSHFVAMVGDGVNDTLALKEADCSIAMASGSDAAKNVSQFVLLDNKIDDLPSIFAEGRRSINNIERSSSLLLSKTLFTVILIVACLFLNTEYFFIPIHLTLITMFTISIPSFVLALEKNNEVVKAGFLRRIVLRSMPSALTVVFNIVIINLFQMKFALDESLCSTLMVFLTATTGFIFMHSICKPYTTSRKVLVTSLIIGFCYCAIFHYEFFSISNINDDTVLVFVVLFLASKYIFDKLQSLSKYLLNRLKN